MNEVSPENLADVQSHSDDRDIPIERVGIKGLRYPIVVLDREQRTQPTVADVSLYVSLPAREKGTHMSRFVEILNEVRNKEVHRRSMPAILDRVRERLAARSAHMEARFPYFVEKAAPVSQIRGLVDYLCFFKAMSNGQMHDFTLGVQVPVQSLCPCSKAISDWGAHNQRSLVEVQVRFGDEDQDFVWIEEVIAWVEASASSPVYSLLKRADEKYVTEQAYLNPVFVEDVVRNVAQKLRADPRITSFVVECENFESIHNHSAFARVSSEAEGWGQ